MRRRALLAASMQSGGGSGIEFPVHLIEGDNGDVGRLLYKYIKDNVSAGVGNEYFFSEEEEIYLLGYEVIGVADYSEYSKKFTLDVTIVNALSVWLDENGTIEIYWD